MMQLVEYGKQNKEVIVLLHGGGLSWWSYQAVAELLQDRYHVILPILDGHAESDSGFSSIADNASTILSYLDQHHNGKVLAIGGLSLGAQILVELLSQRTDICRYAVIESASVIPTKITQMLIRPVFGISYGLIRRKWFSRLQFRALKIREDLYDVYYRDTCKIKKSDLISILEASASYCLKESIRDTTAKICILVGGREQRNMIRSAHRLHQMIKNSELNILDGYHHGELGINHAKEYRNLLEHILSQSI